MCIHNIVSLINLSRATVSEVLPTIGDAGATLCSIACSRSWMADSSRAHPSFTIHTALINNDKLANAGTRALRAGCAVVAVKQNTNGSKRECVFTGCMSAFRFLVRK